MPLNPLTPADLELILPWRNAPTVRCAMFHHNEITLNEHCAWFEGLRQDPCRRWYLYRDMTGIAQGVVYFTDIDTAKGTAFWGFYTRPEAPSGTGLPMLTQALDVAFNEIGLNKLSTKVLVDNLRSLHLHKKIGFTEEDYFREQHFDGMQRVDIVRLGLLAHEWPANRERLWALILTRQIDRAFMS